MVALPTWLGQQLKPKTNSQQLDYERGSMHQILRLPTNQASKPKLGLSPIPKSSFECDHVVSRYKQISIIPLDPLAGYPQCSVKFQRILVSLYFFSLQIKGICAAFADFLHIIETDSWKKDVCSHV